MELECNNGPERNPSAHVSQYSQTQVSYCSQCYHLMDEIRRLQMELDCLKQNCYKVKKNFTIAPTLYTFFRDGLSKRRLARYYAWGLAM